MPCQPGLSLSLSQWTRSANFSPTVTIMKPEDTTGSDSSRAQPAPSLPSESDSEPNTSLHAEFRTLTVLLSLITNMNNLSTGHPILVKEFEEEYRGPLEILGQTTHSFGLNAAAAILARDNEIVAVAGPSRSLPTGDSPPYLLLIQDAPQASLKDPRFVNVNSTAAPECSLTQRNIHFLSEGALFPSMLLKTGTSHWPSIQRDPWYGLTLR